MTYPRFFRQSLATLTCKGPAVTRGAFRLERRSSDAKRQPATDDQ
jgi:hypothetical protein